MIEFNFVENTFMVPYTGEVADYCDPFSCGDDDLDEFFSNVCSLTLTTLILQYTTILKMALSLYIRPNKARKMLLGYQKRML